MGICFRRTPADTTCTAGVPRGARCVTVEPATLTWTCASGTPNGANECVSTIPATPDCDPGTWNGTECDHSHRAPVISDLDTEGTSPVGTAYSDHFSVAPADATVLASEQGCALSGTAGSYTLTVAAPDQGDKRTCTVEASNTAGTAQASITVTFEDDDDPPSEPVVLRRPLLRTGGCGHDRGEIGRGRIWLEWYPVTAPDGRAVEYAVERVVGTAASTLEVVGGPSASVGGAALGATYVLRVRARLVSDSSTVSDPSSTLPVICPRLNRPPVPRAVSASCVDGTLVVEWEAGPAEPRSRWASEYRPRVFLWDEAARAWEKSTNWTANHARTDPDLTSFTATLPAPGEPSLPSEAFQVRVKAKNPAGASDFSSPARVGGCGAMAPELTGLTVVCRQADSKVAVSWNPVEGASSYQAEVSVISPRSSQPRSLPVRTLGRPSPNAEPPTLFTLDAEAGLRYEATVTATTPNGTATAGPAGDTCQAVLPPAPAITSAECADGTLTLNWRMSAQEGPLNRAKSFQPRVFLYNEDTEAWEQSADWTVDYNRTDPDEELFTMTLPAQGEPDLPDGGFQIRVKASNTAGDSAFSAAAGVSCPNYNPEGFEVSCGADGRVIAKWSPVVANRLDVHEYEVVEDGGDLDRFYGTFEKLYGDKIGVEWAAEPLTTYSLTLRAIERYVPGTPESDWTPPAIATCGRFVPQNASASCNSHGVVKVEWDATTGADKYELEGLTYEGPGGVDGDRRFVYAQRNEGEAYTFRVRAHTSGAWSDQWSNTATTTCDPLNPAAPVWPAWRSPNGAGLIVTEPDPDNPGGVIQRVRHWTNPTLVRHLPDDTKNPELGRDNCTAVERNQNDDGWTRTCTFNWTERITVRANLAWHPADSPHIHESAHAHRHDDSTGDYGHDNAHHHCTPALVQEIISGPNPPVGLTGCPSGAPHDDHIDFDDGRSWLDRIGSYAVSGVVGGIAVASAPFTAGVGPIIIGTVASGAAGEVLYQLTEDGKVVLAMHPTRGCSPTAGWHKTTAEVGTEATAGGYTTKYSHIIHYCEGREVS